MSEAQPNGQQPAAPAQPQAITIPDGSVVRAKIDGRDVDVPGETARRFVQMGSAAEKRLQEANAYLNANRAQVDSMQRLASVARSVGMDPTLLTTDPDAALKALAARLGGQAGAGSPSQLSQDDGSDPDKTALRATISELTSKLHAVGTQVTSLTNSSQKAALDQQLESVLGAYPLFNGNATQRGLAKKLIVATWMADPQRSLTEVAGEVHAEFGDAETAKVNHERDTRAAAELRNRGIPAGMGQPGMSTPEGPSFTPEERRAGGVRNWMKQQVGKGWGAVK